MRRTWLLAVCVVALATSAAAQTITTPVYDTASLALVGLGLTSAALGIRRRRPSR